MQLKKIIPAGKPPLAEVKDQLRQDLQHDQAVDSVTNLVNKLDDQLGGGQSLEDIADTLKLRLVKVLAVDSNGKMPDGKAPAELPGGADTVKAAFGQGSGETSPILDDKNGNYFIVRTDGVTPSAPKPFDSVKAKVADNWKNGERKRLAAAEAEKIAKALRDGKTPASFAVQKGIDVRVSKPISMLGAKDPALPASALPQIMGMKKGDVITTEQDNEQLVLRLAEIVPVDPKVKSDDDRNMVAGTINARLTDELTDKYLHYLRSLYPVTIHQDTLQAVADQGG
jgi:peptidyl-prolyl cis-trans isomerase D